MKKNKKILSTLVLAFLICFSLGIINIQGLVKADFEIKKDIVYEDFLLNDQEINDVVKNGTNIDLGKKPYLHIEYNDTKNNVTAYTQYLNTKLLDSEGEGDTIIKLRLKSSSLTLDELILNIGINEDPTNKVYHNSPAKRFRELKDTNNQSLPTISDEYQEFIIDIKKSFLDSDNYSYVASYIQDTVRVKDCPILYIQISSESNNFDLDIDEISTCSEEEYLENEFTVWNDFVGDLDYKNTAHKNTNINANGISTMGSIVPRTITMNAMSSFEITHLNSNQEVVAYSGNYLHIDAVGDLENLKVYLSDDADSYKEPVSYNDYIKLNKRLYNLKLEYTGEENVLVKEVYFTEYCLDDIITKVPYIHYSNTNNENYIALDKFNAEQIVFISDKATAQEKQSHIFTQANAEYRCTLTPSTQRQEMKISDSMLEIDSTENLKNETINYVAKYNVDAKDYQYMVFKIKLVGMASLEDLSFCFDENTSRDFTKYRKYDEFYCGYGLKSPVCDESNPYILDNNFYFLIIDMGVSEIAKNHQTFISLNYSGKGKILIDEIFLSNEKTNEVLNVEEYSNTISFNKDNITEITQTIDLDVSSYNVLELSVKLESNMIAYEGEGTQKTAISNKFNLVKFKFDENEYTINDLYSTTGLKISEYFPKNMNLKNPTILNIDLAKSGIKNTKKLHIISDNLGYFTLSNIKLFKVVNYEDYKEIEEDGKVKIYTNANDTENVISEVKLNLSSSAYKVFETTFLVETLDLLSSLVFDFDGVKYYFSDNENLITLTNGIYLRDLKINSNEKTKIYIDLSLMNVIDCEILTIYGNKNAGNIEFSDFYLGNYISCYKMINLFETEVKQEEKPADIYAPMLTLKDISASKYEGRIEVQFTYYDEQAKNVEDLLAIINVTKTRNAEGNLIGETIEYTLKDVEIVTVKNVQKYSCKICFNGTVGVYKVTTSVTDKANITASLSEVIEVKRDPALDQKETFNWAILLYIGLGLLGAAIITVSVIFIIKYIKSKETRIKF